VPSQIFTREAVLLIHEHSGGIPRTINVIADNALLGGLAGQQKPVGMQLVRDVCRDFDIATPRVTAARAARPPTGPRGARPISASEQRMLDSALPESDRESAEISDPSRGDGTPEQPESTTRREKIANWAAPAISALGLRKR
jgi:hypothetical protein